MSANKRTTIQIEHDRGTILRLALEGQTQAAIGLQLGLSQQMICYDLRVIRKRWLESARASIDEKIALELAKLDNLEGIFWSQWNVSKNICYLTGIERIIAARCKLLGLNGAAKIDITSGQTSLDEVLSRALGKAYGDDEETENST